MEIEKRKKIYEKLGLPFGSLKEESGNDWVRALKEVNEEERQLLFESINQLEFDYANCSKQEKEYQRALHSIDYKDDCRNHIIATREDLTSDEIDILLEGRNKDVFISIAKRDNLTDKQIEAINKKGTLLAKQYLKDKIKRT